MRFLKLIFILLIMIIGAALAVMNADPVQLNYYFGSIELPLSVVLVGSIATGAALGLLATLGGFFRLKRQNMELKRKAKLASQEVNNLRSIPIKD
ncbi:MAG: LapA family protein [Chromatiales bacterium]|nr:LapA family protein [Chromatiales bacterium]